MPEKGQAVWVYGKEETERDRAMDRVCERERDRERQRERERAKMRDVYMAET